MFSRKELGSKSVELCKKRDFGIDLLFHDGNQDINRYGDPYLCLYCVLSTAVETLDTKMLFDPFEE